MQLVRRGRGQITIRPMMMMMMMMMMILITSGQTNLTTGRIADAHGRFNIIRKVAPPV